MKKLHSISGTGVKKISNVACGFSPIKIDYPKCFINRINEVFFSRKYHYSDILLKTPKFHL